MSTPVVRRESLRALSWRHLQVFCLRSRILTGNVSEAELSLRVLGSWRWNIKGIMPRAHKDANPIMEPAAVLLSRRRAQPAIASLQN